MVREICRDEAFLSQRAEPATKDDLGTAQDLLDTLLAHKEGCVGMAANMIGVNKRIMPLTTTGPIWSCSIPSSSGQSEPYEAEEGCLSLTGTPEGEALPLHQGAVAERNAADTAEDLHRLDGGDHPARGSTTARES